MAVRARKFKASGCDFAKWRQVITIDEETGAPTELCLEEGARAMALYAAICQREGLLPIIGKSCSDEAMVTIAL